MDVVLATYVPGVDDVLAAVTPAARAFMIPNLVGKDHDWAGIKAGLTAVGRADFVLIEDSADTMMHTPDAANVLPPCHSTRPTSSRGVAWGAWS